MLNLHWFDRLTVRSKLTGGFLFVAAIAAIIGVIGINSASQFNQLASVMYERELMGVRTAGTAHEDILVAGRSARSALLSLTKIERKANIELTQKKLESAHKNLKSLEDLFVTEVGKQKVRDTELAVANYEASVVKMLGVLETEPPGEAFRAMDLLNDEVRQLGDKAEAQFTDLMQGKLNNAKRNAESTAALFDRILVIMIALTIGGALIAIALGTLLTRGLTRQLGGEPRDVAAAATAIAKGDLTASIDTSRAGEGSIVHAMSQMQQSLRQVVAAVRQSSDSIATGANQIAAGSSDLSQRTEEQAANITETAAAMEELASTVRNNADVAGKATSLAQDASSVAKQGGAAVDDVVRTMEGIAGSSSKIVNIIGVIDSIAFQTNILALNASVEAARAGEEGRGFAVVANEVRGLAQKSAAAAKEIKALIDDSVAHVETGTQIAAKAGQTMQGILDQVHRVSDLIQEISAATTEQASGLDQVNRAISQLSDVTQQNAALVEESAAAAGSLDDQARDLVAAVGTFRLEQSEENQRHGYSLSLA